MKISHAWLQTYFNAPLPSAEKLAELITFHAFEVEGIEKINDDSVIDISILPNRAHDCLSYEGMAREIGMLTELEACPRELKDVPESDMRELCISVEDHLLCPRYTGRRVEGIRVGHSPEWLQTRLASIGQGSINNIVDVMNFVMFETGQPLHVFDADKLESITVRKARVGEKITTLDGKDMTFDESVLVIADKNEPLAIAGIKGGKKAEVTGETKKIVIESANFAPENIRKTSKKIGIRTDASARYENGLTPEKTTEAMRYAVSILSEFARGTNFKAGKVQDAYPRSRQPFFIGISLRETNALLGTSFLKKTLEEILMKLQFEFRTVVPHEEVLRLAPTFLGVPYSFGASVSYDAPKTFDCSSFVNYLYARNGVSIPRVSADIYIFSEKINEEKAIPGDIIFSNTGTGKIFYESVEYRKGTKIPQGVDHCGIYLGNGTVAHSTGKKGVIIEKVGESEQFKNIAGYGRVATPGENRFVVTTPAERLDLRIKEDLIEEIGRVYGYEKIASVKPTLGNFHPFVNESFYYADKIRKVLIENGFSEISTYTFTDSGDIEMENPIASDKKFLRRDLAKGMIKALETNRNNAPLLGLDEVRLFEIGKVFEKKGEYLSLCIAAKKNVLSEIEKKLSEAFTVSVRGEMQGEIFTIDLDTLFLKLSTPTRYEFQTDTKAEKKYQKISPYPFVLRDIAIFVPEGVKENEVLGIIMAEAGELLAQAKLFDVFQKTFENGTQKTSYAFRLVFQSQEKTLVDEEVNMIMEKVTEKLNTNGGWQVR